MLASINCTTTRIRIIRSKKRLAGRTCDANFTTSTKRTDSPIAMTAMQRIGELYGIEEQNSAARHPVSDAISGKPGPSLCSNDLYRWFKDTLTPGIGQIRSCHRDPLCNVPMESAHALCRQRHHRNRQQRRRARIAFSCPRKEKLSVCRLRCWRRASCCHLQSGWLGKAARLSIHRAYLRQCHRTHRRSSGSIVSRSSCRGVWTFDRIWENRLAAYSEGVNAPRPDAYAVIVLASGKTTKSEQANRSD